MNNPQLVSAEKYQRLLEKLLAQGKGYAKSATTHIRVGVEVEEAVVIPVKFDPAYKINAGGMMMLSEVDITALSQALDEIRSGKQTPEQALLEQANGKTISKFDVYGFDSGVLEKLGYGPVELDDNAKAISARFLAVAIQKPARPKYLSVFPETATFAKKKRTAAEAAI